MDTPKNVWIIDGSRSVNVVCSECNFGVYNVDFHNYSMLYCPRCGSKNAHILHIKEDD